MSVLGLTCLAMFSVSARAILEVGGARATEQERGEKGSKNSL